MIEPHHPHHTWSSCSPCKLLWWLTQVQQSYSVQSSEKRDVISIKSTRRYVYTSTQYVALVGVAVIGVGRAEKKSISITTYTAHIEIPTATIATSSYLVQYIGAKTERDRGTCFPINCLGDTQGNVPSDILP